VAGGVFAQESNWNVWGDVEIGTRLNFDPNPDLDNDDPATVKGIGYNEYGAINGKINIGYYGKEGLSVYLFFNTRADTGLGFDFNGNNFRGKIEFGNFLANIINEDKSDGATVNALWGEYGFFDGIVTLMAAYWGPDETYWESNTTGALGPNKKNMWNATAYNGSADPFQEGWTWGNVKEGKVQGLVTRVELGALNFGVIVPGLFVPWSSGWGYEPTEVIPYNKQAKFVDNTLKKAILGVKFDQSPFEFAAQFQLENYGIYFGGKFFAGPITVGLSFMGMLDGDGRKSDVAPNDADPQALKIGGKVEYDGGIFGVGLKGFYERDERDYKYVGSTVSDFYLSTIGVEPFFFYDAIPSTLRFKLDAGMYFFSETDGNAAEKATVWALQPQLFYSLNGTGSMGGGYPWGWGTGILIRYRLANADLREFTALKNYSANFLDFVFCWNF